MDLLIVHNGIVVPQEEQLRAAELLKDINSAIFKLTDILYKSESDIENYESFLLKCVKLLWTFFKILE